MINKLLYLVLGVVSCLLYPCRIQKDKITFISYHTNRLEKDFKLISDELKRRQHNHVVYVLIKYKSSLFGKLQYLLNCMVQLYHIHTSRVVLLDFNNYVISHFKKKGVIVIQVWHASGAIKKFGNDINRDYQIKNYDYVLVTSKRWKHPYSTAFNVSEEQVLPLGIPQTDVLFSKKKMGQYHQKMLKKYPCLNGKTVVLYAPTFRGSNYKDAKYKKVDLTAIQSALGDDYFIIYKLHPLLQEVKLEESNQLINGSKESIVKLLAIADYLITDYSAVLFDFIILNKPIIAFVPDLKTYEQQRGMYLNYEKDIPAPICYTEEQVVEAIQQQNFDLKKLQHFYENYFDYRDGKSTQRVVDFIEQFILNQ